MSGSGREAFPDVWEWLGGPPRCPGVVGRPYRMSGSGPDTLPGCPKGPPGCPGRSGGPAGCPGVVWMPSRMSGSGREALRDVREWS